MSLVSSIQTFSKQFWTKQTKTKKCQTGQESATTEYSAFSIYDFIQMTTKITIRILQNIKHETR